MTDYAEKECIDKTILHECCACEHMKDLTDNSGRTIYFCMFDQSPCYLGETGILGWCELDGFAEELYHLSME